MQIYNCGRRDIEAGLIDRRVLADDRVPVGLRASTRTCLGLDCGHSVKATTGIDAQGATGESVDISKINNIPVLGHQGPGSITDITIRRLLTLQGAMAPDEIISDMAYKGQPTTLALPDHANRIQVTFTPDYGANNKLSQQVKSLLQPNQWVQLINRSARSPSRSSRSPPANTRSAFPATDHASGCAGERVRAPVPVRPGRAAVGARPAGRPLPAARRRGDPDGATDPRDRVRDARRARAAATRAAAQAPRG